MPVDAGDPCGGGGELCLSGRGIGWPGDKFLIYDICSYTCGQENEAIDRHGKPAAPVIAKYDAGDGKDEDAGGQEIFPFVFSPKNMEQACQSQPAIQQGREEE